MLSLSHLHTYYNRIILTYSLSRSFFSHTYVVLMPYLIFEARKCNKLEIFSSMCDIGWNLTPQFHSRVQWSVNRVSCRELIECKSQLTWIWLHFKKIRRVINHWKRCQNCINWALHCFRIYRILWITHSPRDFVFVLRLSNCLHICCILRIFTLLCLVLRL